MTMVVAALSCKVWRFLSQAAHTFSPTTGSTAYGVAIVPPTPTNSGQGGLSWALGSGSTAPGASVSTGGVLSYTGLGTVAMVAEYLGGGNYAASPYSANYTVTITQGSQAAPTVTSSATTIYGNAYTATASASGGAPVWSISSATAPGAAINSATGALTTTGTGTVTLSVYYAATSTYAASPSSTSVITVTARPITIGLSGSKDFDGTTAWSSSFGDSVVAGTLASGDSITPGTAAGSAIGTYSTMPGMSISNGTAPTNRTSSYTIAYSGTYAVNATPTVSVTPATTTIDVSQTASALTANATLGSGGFTYQWYSNTVNNTTTGTLISGATGSSYVPPTAGAGTLYYYAKATDSLGGSATSNAVAVTTNNTPSFTQQPAAKTIDAGQSTSFTATAAGGTGALSYQWYSNAINSTSGGTPIAGQNTSTYSTGTVASAGTRYIYVIATDSSQTPYSVASSTALFTINADPTVAISANTHSATYGQSGVATETATPSGGSGSYTYQWYSNTVNSNSGGAAISAATSSTYAVGTTAVGSTYYYVTVTDSYGVSATSATSVYTVGQATPLFTSATTQSITEWTATPAAQAPTSPVPWKNPYSLGVTQPTGTTTYQILSGPSGSLQINQYVTTGFMFDVPGTFTVQAAYGGDSNYTAATQTLTWTVADGTVTTGPTSGIPGPMPTQTFPDPADSIYIQPPSNAGVPSNGPATSTMNVILWNTGTAPLNLIGWSSNNALFSVNGGVGTSMSPVVILPGQSGTITLQFGPAVSGTGLKSGTITLSATQDLLNPIATGSIAIPVNGTVYAPSATITWQ